jgi:ABC-2 type transport system ATP-binding protein
MDAVLLAENVRREYGETVALDGVSLAVDEGEVFALVGPNGAGKTTLVRALTGTTAVDGSVSVFDDSPSAVEESRLGVLPQSFSPPARLSARELLAYYAGLYDDPRDVDGVLDDVGMAESANTRYENLSGGQQRRTCVGATLVNGPDLLVLDEPTTGIDPAGRRALWELLDGLAAGGTTILLTTHYMAEAERLANRVGLLADGKLAAVGTPSDLIAEYGGRTRLEIATDADTTALDVAHPLESTPTGIVVDGVSATDIGAVVDALERHGIEYGELAWRQPDLEDVYLTVTDESRSPSDADEERSLTGAEREAGAVQ